jgi:xanthine dehydrogenase YagS FAD-binding subunit
VHPVEYRRASALEDALTLGAGPEASYYAGGTTLIDLMKLDVLTPAVVVDINHLPFAQIEAGGDVLRLGALARMSDTADSAIVGQHVPALAQALNAGASGQVRNMATLGGNLLQRTRCAYFRDVATPCNKREPRSGCGALMGVNAEHAVLGTSDSCIAVHASDFAVPLAAFDARVVVQSRGGSRTVDVADFFLTPGDTPDRETALAPGELITRIDVPLGPCAANSTYVKVRERTSFAFALASCAAGIERSPDGTIADARVALGGVATVPWRARAAEDVLRGKTPSRALLFAAARAALGGARATLQNAYKIELAVAAIVRALETVTA